jgi:hypothetical protein
MRRPLLSVLVGAALAAVGAVILGEYPLVGSTPLVAGLLFGIAVAEAIATVGRTSDGHLRAAAALLTEAGLVWATWISTGHRLRDASSTAWAGVIVGSVAAPLWLRSVGRRGARTPPAPAPPPAGPGHQPS